MLKSVREFGGVWETSVILYLPQRKSPFDGKNLSDAKEHYKTHARHLSYSEEEEASNLKALLLHLASFLAVQDSSIGDLVSH